MKRLCAVLIALLMAIQLCAIAEEATDTDIPEQAVVYDHLTVGNVTPMRGDFFTELWGNATSDDDARALLHGYNLVMWNAASAAFVLDPSVVSGISVTENQAGDRTYLLVLYDDLYYSDGTQITAWDYAFSTLLQISREITELGGTLQERDYLLGCEAYLNGTAKGLQGLRVLSDHTLSFTVSHEYLPFFYELALLNCNPYPISVIAPGVVVRDDGEGAYLANEDETVKEPVFSAELLRQTILDPQTGYRSHPSVVSGPYTLTSWDGTTAEFAINPYYKGNANGDRPTIQTLTYTLAYNDSMMDQLANGTFGLLNKVLREDVIREGIALLEDGRFAMSAYPRIGLGFICFACERDTVSSQAVRQAIAWCLDRDQLTADYAGGFGQRVDGWYGIGQWMYGIAAGTTPPPVEPPENEADTAAMAAYEEQLQAYEAISLDTLTQYTLDTATAARLLDEDGWMLNEEGIREKDGVTLDLRMIYPQGNNIEEMLKERLQPNLAEVGIRLTMEAVPMQELLTSYYRQEDRDADMIWLGSNFEMLFDPAVNFMESENGEHSWGFSALNDPELYELAAAMRSTEPGDVLTYMQRWLAFQQEFNRALPMLPVYGNIYFDFYTGILRNYNIAPSITWGNAIVGAYLQEELPEAEEIVPDDDGTVTFDE